MVEDLTQVLGWLGALVTAAIVFWLWRRTKVADESPKD